ncbi:hypothetical protein FRC05_000385 [Tulasnella sp. 425]|nr:hypothetical protein FRC05_000385 [Tulasnella sp. 425]
MAPPTPQIAPNPGTSGPGPDLNMSGGHFVFVACGAAVGSIVILAACAMWRIRLARRRSIALGLPPVEVQRPREKDTDDLKDKPAIYDVCLVFGEGVEGEQLRWDQMQALSSTRVLSVPAPPRAEDMDDPFNNYFTSFLKLVSVERMDKALLRPAAKDHLPEYARAEIFTSVVITMPQPRRGLTAASRGLAELELGVYEGESHRL